MQYAMRFAVFAPLMARTLHICQQPRKYRDCKGENMKTTKMTVIALLAGSLALGGCSGMTTRQQNAAVGAAVGGVAGAVLTGGSSFGTVGGAAIGGIIGHGIDGGGSKKK